MRFSNHGGVLVMTLALLYCEGPEAPDSAILPSANALARLDETRTTTDRLPSFRCPPPRGSGCTYIHTLGTARIVALEMPRSWEYSCQNDPVRVVLDFTPDDLRARACYTMSVAEEKGYTFTIGAGANPSRNCVDALGLTVGETVRAERLDISHGSCSPLVYEHPDLDIERCNDLCTY